MYNITEYDSLITISRQVWFSFHHIWSINTPIFLSQWTRVVFGRSFQAAAVLQSSHQTGGDFRNFSEVDLAFLQRSGQLGLETNTGNHRRPGMAPGMVFYTQKQLVLKQHQFQLLNSFWKNLILKSIEWPSNIIKHVPIVSIKCQALRAPKDVHVPLIPLRPT